MLFRRRDPARFGERIRVFFWPRRSWERSVRYVLHRLRRLKSSPHAIALGFSSGIFASFTPFMGCHFILAGLLSWVTRSSILASALGTFVGNPLTFPIIWLSTYKLGSWMLGQDPKKSSIDISDGIFQSSFDNLLPLIKPMLVGGVPLGLLAAVLGYFPMRRAVEVYRARREQLRKFAAGRGPVQA